MQLALNAALKGLLLTGQAFTFLGMKSIAKKKGRHRVPYLASWGERINGLRRRKNDGRWVVLDGGFMFTEPDERLAILRFRRWEAKRKGHSALVELPLPSDPDPDPDAAGAVDFIVRKQLGLGDHHAPNDESLILRIAENEPLTLLRAIPEPALWAYVRQEIIARPKWVAEQTGIEQIGYLENLTKPTPSPSLVEVGNLYFDKAKITSQWCGKCRSFWKEFQDSVEATTLRELTQEMIAGYKSDVLDNQRNDDFSPTYVKHRFDAVKTIINFSRQWGKWPEDRVRALAYCGILIAPTSISLDPHPIARDDFHKLFNAADEQFQAMFLLALNCCMYGTEVCDLRWPDFNLDDGTLISDRGKTGVARVAVLWKRTIEALRKLRRIPDSDVIFITNATKQLHNVNTVGKAFRALRKAVGVDQKVTFCYIRDGAYTTACENVSYEQGRILGGHRLGMSDHYVKRRPKIVADACKAIEFAYFG